MAIVRQTRGTRFLIYPQTPMLQAYSQPITVSLAPAVTIAPGPADDRLQLVDAVAKNEPYDASHLPPYRGAVHLPVMPGPDGHFDHLQAGTRQFNAAHMYAVIRCVLDIWEGYFSRPIDWHFRDYCKRLELIPFVDWENAQSGFAYIEAGYDISARGDYSLHCLNFDVLAHEFGHTMLYSKLGIPPRHALTNEYLAVHEAGADLTALVAMLHFESVVDRLLANTHGNLYVLNELNRIGELSESDQIRIASNLFKMSAFAEGWDSVHQLALPLSGAIFDLFVDVFQHILIRTGLIDGELARLCNLVPDPALDYAQIQGAYQSAYERRHAQFKQALLDARDYLGRCLALTWEWMSPEWLSFAAVGDMMIEVDKVISAGRFGDSIRENFRWREIGSVKIAQQPESSVQTSVHSCRS